MEGTAAEWKIHLTAASPTETGTKEPATTTTMAAQAKMTATKAAATIPLATTATKAEATIPTATAGG